MHVGFIGLGDQGAPIAGRILSGGFPLMVWARRREAMTEFAVRGAVMVETAAALGVACDIVAICVLDDAGVAEICAQVIPAMRPGSVLVIHSTILPDHCESLARECTARGIGFLDAPVSGGRAGAEAGTLTVMCGGSEEAHERVRPVLETFAGLLLHLGPAGSGQRAKIINNALLAANIAMADAALAAGEALGLDRDALVRMTSASSGRSYGFELRSRLDTAPAFGKGAPLLAKDIRLLRSILPGDAAAAKLFDAASPFLAAALGEPVLKD